MFYWFSLIWSPIGLLLGIYLPNIVHCSDPQFKDFISKPKDNISEPFKSHLFIYLYVRFGVLGKDFRFTLTSYLTKNHCNVNNFGV